MEAQEGNSSILWLKWQNSSVSYHQWSLERSAPLWARIWSLWSRCSWFPGHIPALLIALQLGQSHANMCQGLCFFASSLSPKPQNIQPTISAASRSRGDQCLWSIRIPHGATGKQQLENQSGFGTILTLYPVIIHIRNSS